MNVTKPILSELSIASARQANLDREERKIIRYIGGTTDLELALFEDLPANLLPSLGNGSTQVQRYEAGIYVEVLSDRRQDVNVAYLEELERLVSPQQDNLIESYLDNVQSSFPLLSDYDISTLKSSRAAIDPALLAAIFLFASTTASSTDFGMTSKLEEMASSLLQESFIQPRLSTIQAALLISQLPSFNSSLLTMQINAAAFDLCLHQDCASWEISSSHKSLRKRLAWALYAHDKWSAFSTGRPSLISPANWTVPSLIPGDFDEPHATVPTIELFTSFITLSTLLSSVLDTFYTLSSATMTSPQQVLAVAKPVQLQLKDWYSQLPSCLKMENSTVNFDMEQQQPAPTSSPSFSSTRCLGFLHLSYFTAEILLHRRIIQSLSASVSDTRSADYTPLHHICRLAAKTRLISALDFLNRLRSYHLHSAFWPVGSRTQFSMIGSFGTLLLATSPTVEEEEFYAARLRELGWTLGSCASSFSSSSPRTFPNNYNNYEQFNGGSGDDRLGFASTLQNLDLSLGLWDRGRAAKGDTKKSVRDVAEEIKEMSNTVEHQRRHAAGAQVVGDKTMTMMDSPREVDDEDDEMDDEDDEDEDDGE